MERNWMNLVLLGGLILGAGLAYRVGQAVVAVFARMAALLAGS